MKRLISIVSIALLAAILIPGPVLAAPQLHRVTGGGTANIFGYNETYGFSAIQVDSSGNAKGEIQFTWHYPSWHNLSDPWTLHADVLYLAVDEATSDAWIGGVITQSSDPYDVGTEFVIRVQDNGEGKKVSEPDMIGYYMEGTAYTALSMPTDGYFSTLFPFTHGNIQVK